MTPDQLKRKKLSDILRRLLANPGTVPDVVEQIAMDWFPVFRIDEKGRTEIVVGDGHKR